MLVSEDVDEGRASRGAPLSAELDGYRQQFEAVKTDARALVDGLSDSQFNWRPAAGAWSIGECLAHLNVTGQFYLPRIDRRIAAARAAGELGEGPFRYGFVQRMFVRGVEPPGKLKFKAPKIFAPMPEHLLSVIVPAFMNLQDQFVERPARRRRAAPAPRQDRVARQPARAAEHRTTLPLRRRPRAAPPLAGPPREGRRELSREVVNANTHAGKGKAPLRPSGLDSDSMRGPENARTTPSLIPGR
jgi:hypothetical protein